MAACNEQYSQMVTVCQQKEIHLFFRGGWRALKKKHIAYAFPLSSYDETRVWSQ